MSSRMRNPIRLTLAALLLFTLIWVYERVGPLSTAAQWGDGEQEAAPLQEAFQTGYSGDDGQQAGSPTESEGAAGTAVMTHVASADANADAETTQGDLSLPNNDAGSKVVVMAKMANEDTSWVSEKLQDWQSSIYTVDDLTAPLHTTANKGREANAYLTYIVDNYAALPETIAFIHSHEKGYPKAWHTDAADHSNVNALNALQIPQVQTEGYVNLRCGHIPGCPDEIQPFREPYEEHRTAEHAFSAVYQYVFNTTEADVPRIVGVACCAQFAVSRRQIHARPLEDYLRFHHFLLETELDDETSGRVFEYLWHIMFGKGPVQWVRHVPLAW